MMGDKVYCRGRILETSRGYKEVIVAGKARGYMSVFAQFESSVTAKDRETRLHEAGMTK